VSGRVLHESGLVAKTVTAVLSHAVEVRLVLPVAAMSVMTVLVEPESQVSLGNRFVLEDAHRVLDARLPHFRAHVPRGRHRQVDVVMRRRGGRPVAAAGRLAGPVVVQQPVVAGRRQHGLVVVEAGRWREHQTYKNRNRTSYDLHDYHIVIIRTVAV